MNTKQTPSATAAQSPQSGYILLEALVALLIFSLGLLGLIGFQAASTKIATDSRFRTEAAMLADELLAKMTASDVNLVASEFAYPNGPKYKAWLDNRVVGASRLPNVTVTPTFTSSATKGTLLVDLEVRWEMPGVAKDAKQIKEVKGYYVTRALLF
ncbi:prepilin-type N-terminal cleavage/methylation domain-containing protein [Zoogloea sp.]|jgi:type IV pilus assembly protein PilV|uniref:type IV pilus modification PilV family protein n=1 Tax=Zoogloea sp. TaxID=49181 RepID=UPI0035B09F9B